MTQPATQATPIPIAYVIIHIQAASESYTVLTGSEPIPEPVTDEGDFVWKGRVLNGTELQFTGELPEWVDRHVRSDIMRNAMYHAVEESLGLPDVDCVTTARLSAEDIPL